MRQLILGLLIFFGVHSIAIVAPHWREHMRARVGAGAWRAVYSVLSLLGLWLMIRGFAHATAAPHVLYTPPAWLHYLTRALMLPVFPLLLAAYMPGRIQTLARHPMLLAIKLWALAHLLSNGTTADLLLFGAFLLWAGIDRISVRRRAAPAPAGLPASKFNDVLALVLGLVLYALFVGGLHVKLFGVSPLV